MILPEANELLSSTISDRTAVNTPVRKYIQKLTTGTEKLQAQTIVHQHDASSLRSTLKKRMTRKKGKRAVLKCHFHISTQELCDGVIAAEKETQMQAGKRGKKKGKAIFCDAESDGDIEEHAQDETESGVGDYIVVNIVIQVLVEWSPEIRTVTPRLTLRRERLWQP